MGGTHEQSFYKTWVVPAFQYFVVYSLAAFYSVYTIFRYAYAYFKNPTDFWTVKPRPIPPKCLNDPELGNHCYIQIKNVKLHYVEAGQKEKPLMLFLHGFPEFWYSWRYQLKEFSKDYWTVAVDMRGYGDSEKPVGTRYYKMKYLTEDVKNLIEALGKDKCILVAHDWGGAVAWNFVRRYPQLIEKYIIMNAPNPTVYRDELSKSFTQFKKAWYIFFFQVPYLPEITLRIRDMAWLKSLFKSNMLNKKVTEEDMEAMKFTFGKPGAFTFPINYYRANMIRNPNRTEPSWNDIDLPKGLFLFGENDIALDIALVERTKALVKELETEIIAGANHFVQQYDPDRVNAAMRKFLGGTFSGAKEESIIEKVIEKVVEEVKESIPEEVHEEVKEE